MKHLIIYKYVFNVILSVSDDNTVFLCSLVVHSIQHSIAVFWTTLIDVKPKLFYALAHSFFEDLPNAPADFLSSLCSNSLIANIAFSLV